jgi:hypothetical protein
MSRFSKLGSMGAVGTLVAVLSFALAPAAQAKSPMGGGMSLGSRGVGSPSFHAVGNPGNGSLQFNKNIGSMPLSKNVGDFDLGKKHDLSFSKVGGDKFKKPIDGLGKFDKIGEDKSKKPIDGLKKIGKIGSDPISKTPHKCPHIDPCDHGFCHHDFCCHPHCHWLFFPLIVEDVVYQCVYNEPLYTLYYETPSNGVQLFSHYELPSESASLFKTERLLDKSGTAWWLVDPARNLVDTNTEDKAAALTTAAE